MGNTNSALSAALGADPTPPPDAPTSISSDQLPSTPAAVSNVQPAAPVNPKFQRTFKNTLVGLLHGLELGGVPGAVYGAVNPQGAQQAVQDIEDKRHFENLKAAHSVALLTAQTSEANVATAEHQAQLNLMNENAALWAKRMGLTPTITVSGSNPQEYDASATAAISSVKAANGGLIPSVVGTNSTIGTGANPDQHETTVYAPGTPTNMQSILSKVETGTHDVPHMVAEYYRAQGRPIPSDNDWANLGITAANAGPAQGMTAAAQNKIAQREAITDASQFFMTTPQLPEGGNAEQTAAKGNVVLQQMKQQLSTYKASGGNDPDTLRQLETRIDTVQSGIDQGVKSATAAKIADTNATALPEAQAAALKAAAEAKARLPFDLAKSKADEALKDGDPVAAGQLLVNGDIAPSQLISSRKPAFAQQAFDAAHKLSGGTWNAQASEGYFKVASSPTNVQFFGSAKSLTDKGGTLDQLQSAYSKLPNGKIPALNTIADWTSAASGGGATAGFAQTALGVADDYAKVMGGGQGSDTARGEILKSFARSGSPQQMQSAIGAARGAVTSQMTSRIGSNPVLRRMYGQGVPPAGATGKAPGSDGRLHWTDGKSDLGVAE